MSDFSSLLLELTSRYLEANSTSNLSNSSNETQAFVEIFASNPVSRLSSEEKFDLNVNKILS